MVIAGVVITAAAAAFLLASYLRAPKLEPYPWYGWAGLAAIALAEALLFGGVELVGVYFTPIAWTGYIMAIDAAIRSVRGHSLITSNPQALVWMAVLSIFLWLIFELYNLHLLNWTYVGLPRNLYARYLGYGWSFATIWPAVLSTSEFLLATTFRGAGAAPPPPEPVRTYWGWRIAGLLMATVPLLMPRDIAVYLFGSVWLGFIFLIDPWNYRRRQPSITGDLLQGYRARLWALLAAGGLCGIFWEFWNHWAQAKWFYIFPILEDWRLFEMPVVGFLGFPPFAVEIFAMYILAASLTDVEWHEVR